MASVPSENFPGITSYHGLAEQKRALRGTQFPSSQTSSEKRTNNTKTSGIGSRVRKIVIAILGLGSVGGVVGYNVANWDTIRGLATMDLNAMKDAQIEGEMMRKAAPELAAIADELDAAEHRNDTEAIQGLLKRLDAVISSLPWGLHCAEAAKTRALAGKASTLLGNAEGAVGHYSYAMNHVKEGKLDFPEASEWETELANATAKLPSMEQRLKNWSQTHGAMSTDTGDNMEKRFGQSAQKQNPPETVAAGGEE